MNARLKALFTEEVTKQCVLLVLNDQKIKHFVILLLETHSFMTGSVTDSLAITSPV